MVSSVYGQAALSLCLLLLHTLPHHHSLLRIGMWKAWCRARRYALDTPPGLVHGECSYFMSLNGNSFLPPSARLPRPYRILAAAPILLPRLLAVLPSLRGLS